MTRREEEDVQAEDRHGVHGENRSFNIEQRFVAAGPRM